MYGSLTVPCARATNRLCNAPMVDISAAPYAPRLAATSSACASRRCSSGVSESFMFNLLCYIYARLTGPEFLLMDFFAIWFCRGGPKSAKIFTLHIYYQTKKLCVTPFIPSSNHNHRPKYGRPWFFMVKNGKVGKVYGTEWFKCGLNTLGSRCCALLLGWIPWLYGSYGGVLG